MPRPIPPEGKKRQRVPLNYQSDFGVFFLIRVDLLIDTENNQYFSPATPKFFQAVANNAPVFSAILRRDFEKRRIEICREMEGNSRVDNITCPFVLPDDISEQTKEIQTQYPSERIRYFGEIQRALIDRGIV